MNKSQSDLNGAAEFINPITGAPIFNQDNLDIAISNSFVPNSIDDGEFLDTTADVSPNSLKHATCGKLSVKYTLSSGKFLLNLIFLNKSNYFRRIEVKCFPVPDALNPCEDVMGSQWLRTSVWIVVFLAVFGNIAVLIVLFSNWYT